MTLFPKEDISMFSKNRLVTIGMTLAIVAVIMRVEPAKAALTGDEKFLGIF